MLASLPSTFRKLSVKQLSTKFRQCTEVVTADMPTVLRPTEVLVRNHYAGVNASDINFSAGTYKVSVKPPFDCGFEAVGEIVQVGDPNGGFQVGDAVVTQAFGGFSEYQVVATRHAKRVPTVEKEWLPLDLSGTTASIALDLLAKPQPGETALVTAAAGGTGQFAVQLLKHVYKCVVVGTCSSDSKRFLLHGLGCDCVIDYSKQDVHQVLKERFPTGVNLVYESVGGKLLDTAVRNLSVKGRILTIGSISGYQDMTSWKPKDVNTNDVGEVPIASQLLMKSASLHGFFLPHFSKHAGKHFRQLVELRQAGTIRSMVDPHAFQGLEQVADAVEYLHSKQNIGKVVVKLT